MRFQYNGEVLYNKELILDDAGNTCLQAIDSVQRCFYLYIRTSLGESTVLEFGPLYSEDELLPEEYTIHFKRIEYSDNAIRKIISDFLRPKKFVGNKKVSIEEVNEIDFDEALSYGIDPFKYLSKYSDTSNY